MTDVGSNLPSTDSKPSLLDWLESFLPFKLPKIPLPQTARNLDKAAASIVTASGDNVVARIRSSTTRIDAMSSAKKTFIELGQSQVASPINDIADRALRYALGDAIDKQGNREEILRIATEHLASDTVAADATDDIDDDWLNSFKRFSETKSNADIQQLWAKILSTEIRKPGSTSLRTLDFLSTVSMSDAKRIVELFKFVIDGFYIPEWVHEKELMSLAELLSLQQIGVISGSIGTNGPSCDKPAVPVPGRIGKVAVVLNYFDKLAIIDTDNEKYRLRFPTAVLSEVGSTLFAITDTKVPDYNFFEDFVVQLGNASTKQILIADIVGRNGDLVGIKNERVIYPTSTSS